MFFLILVILAIVFPPIGIPLLIGWFLLLIILAILGSIFSMFEGG